MTQGTCSVDGCDRSTYARGWCSSHYETWRQCGTPTRREIPREVRFWSKAGVSTVNNCWPWRGHVNDNGYGAFDHGPAHRVAYELVIGPIPEGRHLDHLCRTRGCVNPYHLEPVTAWENTQRTTNVVALNAVKTVCDNGHAFDDANTYVSAEGHRHCRACRAEATRRYRQRKAGAR